MLPDADTEDDTDSEPVPVPHALVDGDGDELLDCDWLVVSVPVTHSVTVALADVEP